MVSYVKPMHSYAFLCIGGDRRCSATAAQRLPALVEHLRIISQRRKAMGSSCIATPFVFHSSTCPLKNVSQRLQALYQ